MAVTCLPTFPFVVFGIVEPVLLYVSPYFQAFVELVTRVRLANSGTVNGGMFEEKHQNA
jgi:hypothetical protein